MWKQIKQHPFIVAGIIVVLFAIIVCGLVVYFGWDWTGFNEHIGPKVQQYQPTKTLWDWLQLLIIPLVLAVGALLFNFANSSTEQKIANQRILEDRQIAAQRYKNDQQIALDKQREDHLQVYLD